MKLQECLDEQGIWTRPNSDLGCALNRVKLIPTRLEMIAVSFMIAIPSDFHLTKGRHADFSEREKYRRLDEVS